MITAKEVQLTSTDENVHEEEILKTILEEVITKIEQSVDVMVVNEVIKPQGRVRSFSTQLIVQEVINNLTCGQIFKSFFVIAFLFLIFSLAAGHFLLFYLYSRAGPKPFARTDREYVWIFLLFSIAFTFLFIWLILRWYKITVDWLQEKYGGDKNSSGEDNDNNSGDNNSGGANLQRVSMREKIGSFFSRLEERYDKSFGLDGSYYLHKLYTSEIVEGGINLYNLQDIYLCTLPVPLTCVICGLLTIESLHRAYVLSRHIRNNGRHKITVQERDHQIILDMLMDIFFLTVPIGTIYIGFKVQVTITQTIWLVFTPSLFLCSKLREMTMQLYFKNAETLILQKQKSRSFSLHRHRRSIFSKTYSDEVEDLQNKTFPRWMKLVVL
eukprot:g13264.t1